ncbi:hypothetical protein FQR65_LT13803 [Abscondita terminalis]|nr:hypothetical protein FQR65_LT13803 [Abscondita terminalis]
MKSSVPSVESDDMITDEGDEYYDLELVNVCQADQTFGLILCDHTMNEDILKMMDTIKPKKLKSSVPSVESDDMVTDEGDKYYDLELVNVCQAGQTLGLTLCDHTMNEDILKMMGEATPTQSRKFRDQFIQQWHPIFGKKQPKVWNNASIVRYLRNQLYSWLFFKELSFLIDTIKPKKMKSSVPSVESDDMITDEGDEYYDSKELADLCQADQTFGLILCDHTKTL